jgi:hypothetical protein
MLAGCEVEVGKDIFNMYLKARTRIKFLKEIHV